MSLNIDKQLITIALSEFAAFHEYFDAYAKVMALKLEDPSTDRIM